MKSDFNLFQRQRSSYSSSNLESTMSSFTEELKEELKKFVSQQLQLVPNFNEEIDSTADYIVLLIANGRSAEETYNEVYELFSNESLKDVIQKTYQALTDYQAQAAQQQAALASSSSQPEQQQQPSSSSQPESSQLSETSTQSKEVDMDDSSSNPNSSFNGFQQRPLNNRSRQGGGISKNGPNGPRNFALKNAGAFQRAMDLSNGGTPMRKKSRCHQFPHCPNKDCMFAHPTRPCFNFPNCPNAPGTCNYLHPGEDDELMAELAKTKQEYKEKRAQIQLKQSQVASGITLCKFGAVCTNPQCPFGHPTPANEDAKVIRLEWCSLNLKCDDATCPKAHSSASKIREVVKQSQPIINTSATQPIAEKSLEQCKFGKNCTNRYCKFRHARTPTMCRDGENCQRIDCLFNHPLKEDCRFGEECKNPKCAFRHPNGKNQDMSGMGSKASLTWTKTDERQFAVPDEQILERIPGQQENAQVKQEELQANQE